MVDRSNPSDKNGLRCPNCRKGGFKRLSAVRDHFVARLHVAHCGKCNVNFPDPLLFIKHSQSHTIEKTSLAPSPLIKPATKPPMNPKIHHNLEQTVILEHLRAACHSPARLQSEGYFLGVSSAEKIERSAKNSIPYEDFLPVPHSKPSTEKRLAIVIDCEMVEAADERRMLAYLSAIDFFTGEVLVNNYVKPTERIHNWKTQFSGVTPALMSCACAAGQAIRGWQSARQRLWDFMNEDTILVGHSLNSDFDVLGMFHLNIVDSAIMTSEAVLLPHSPTERLRHMWGLTTLAKDFLKRDIQNGKSGHSALEDAFATRDVVLWCLSNSQQLQVWAKQTRIRTQKRGSAKRGVSSMNSKGKQKLRGGSSPRTDFDDEYYQDLESLNWSDIAEDSGWPHSDTGYDPWSD